MAQGFSKNLNFELNDLREKVVEFVREELTEQGHNLTGNLLNSVSTRQVSSGDEITILVEHLAYGRFVDQGVRPSRIPFSPGSGARTSKYIEGLKEFVRLRRIAGPLESDILGAAFAIAKKHKKEGMPTRASRRFSSNGRRVGYMSTTLETHRSEELHSLIATAGEQAVTEKFEEFVFRLIEAI